MCVSWALTLFFSLSWRQLPWGALSAWEHKGSPGARPYTHCIYCVSLLQLRASVGRSCCSMQWDCSCLPHCVLYLYPSYGEIPTVNSCHLIQTAEKNRVNPKAQLQTCACTESNSITQTNNSLPQHTDPQLELHLYLPFVTFI